MSGPIFNGIEPDSVYEKEAKLYWSICSFDSEKQKYIDDGDKEKCESVDDGLVAGHAYIANNIKLFEEGLYQLVVWQSFIDADGDIRYEKERADNFKIKRVAVWH